MAQQTEQCFNEPDCYCGFEFKRSTNNDEPESFTETDMKDLSEGKYNKSPFDLSVFEAKVVERILLFSKNTVGAFTKSEIEEKSKRILKLSTKKNNSCRIIQDQSKGMSIFSLVAEC